MKKFKFAYLAVALASVFAFSSCLDDSDDSSDYPDFNNVPVTVGNGGFTLLADNGSYLIPTNSVTGLDQCERAIVSFDVVSGSNVTQLEAGKTYDVEINPNYSYSMTTKRVMDICGDEVALDSLVNSQEAISVENMYAVNGYVTTTVTVNFDYGTAAVMDCAYNSEEDIKVNENALYLTMYYDPKSTMTSYSTTTAFSFRLPEYVYEKLSGDSIDLVMRYKSIGAESTQTKCRMARKDFFRPTF